MSDTMADKMKRKLSAKNATAMILFGAIILVFVFFGLPGKLGAGVGSVARVNNSLISIADFQQEENRVQQYYQNLFGSSMDFSSQRQLLRQQALENLVRNELVSQAAQSEGILATDAEVRDFIVKDIPFFQQNGQFQREFYARYLEQTHSSAGDFENKVRKDIANVRIRHLFELVGQPSAVELKKLHELRSTKINVLFVKIDQEALSKVMTKEKAEVAIQALDAALAKGDEAAANVQLKELKATWEETGFVELGSENFPKITSAVATDAVFELSKAQPLLKRVVRDGAIKYVLKLKETKIEEAKAIEPMTAEMMQKRRADGLFEAWINQFRAKSHVTMNAQALQ
ncbi:SurA N-terminal domain-containing protein [Bdellovibrio svalbardensis]|uniref:SurA N-terminal domain-containing protein n=1 Tax=Bdellovibrio svalbardensis TaxID=2972972 RepID=A0ABT6DI09_9BACT|nr:SurA N-terminal domain-containing protein [Bdellovibrio svalbardensis]MDG0816122.1 SurA N-terminal domain-containing protein [Bdellovibrio svalbardensis]